MLTPDTATDAVERRAQCLLPGLLATGMSAFVALVVTIINTGLDRGLPLRWLLAWLLAWPAAVVAAGAVDGATARLSCWPAGRLHVLPRRGPVNCVTHVTFPRLCPHGAAGLDPASGGQCAHALHL